MTAPRCSLLTTIAVSLAPAPARIRPDQLSASLTSHGYSEAEIFDLVIPKRTLARRRAGNELLTRGGNRQGAPAQAHRRSGRTGVRRSGEGLSLAAQAKARFLKEQTPLAFLASEEGARKVEEMLHRIDHGMAA